MRLPDASSATPLAPIPAGVNPVGRSRLEPYRELYIVRDGGNRPPSVWVARRNDHRILVHHPRECRHFQLDEHSRQAAASAARRNWVYRCLLRLGPARAAFRQAMDCEPASALGRGFTIARCSSRCVRLNRQTRAVLQFGSATGCDSRFDTRSRGRLRPRPRPAIAAHRWMVWSCLCRLWNFEHIARTDHDPLAGEAGWNRQRYGNIHQQEHGGHLLWILCSDFGCFSYRNVSASDYPRARGSGNIFHMSS